jgi:P pilus assembly chaperone PapD
MSFVKKYFLLLVLFSQMSMAGVTITGTRIVFPGNEREMSIRTNNKGNKPALVQIWIDDGKANANLNSVQVPFLVTPPVYRVEPGKGQSLRLIYNGMQLPQDRESLFWFNLLEIPPASTPTSSAAPKQNQLELAFRTRIKIFYRPQGLKESSVAVFNRLEWSVVTDANKGTGIKIHNPTPYYFSFDTGTFTIGSRKYTMEMDYIGPGYSAVYYSNNGVASAGSVSQITARLLNDFGAAIQKTLIKQGNGFIEKAN